MYWVHTSIHSNMMLMVTILDDHMIVVVVPDNHWAIRFLDLHSLRASLKVSHSVMSYCC